MTARHPSRLSDNLEQTPLLESVVQETAAQETEVRKGLLVLRDQLSSAEEEQVMVNRARGVNRTRVKEMRTTLRMELAVLLASPLTEESIAHFEKHFREQMRSLTRRNREPHYLKEFRLRVEGVLGRIRETLFPQTVVPTVQEAMNEEVVETLKARDPMEEYLILEEQLEHTLSREAIQDMVDQEGKDDDQKAYNRALAEDVQLWLNEYAKSPDANAQIFERFQGLLRIEKNQLKKATLNTRLTLLLLKREVLAAILGSRVENLFVKDFEKPNLSVVAEYISELTSLGKVQTRSLSKLEEREEELQSIVAQFRKIHPSVAAVLKVPESDDIVFPDSLENAQYLLDKTSERVLEIRQALENTLTLLNIAVKLEEGGENNPESQAVSEKAKQFLEGPTLEALQELEVDAGIEPDAQGEPVVELVPAAPEYEEVQRTHVPLPNSSKPSSFEEARKPLPKRTPFQKGARLLGRVGAMAAFLGTVFSSSIDPAQGQVMHEKEETAAAPEPEANKTPSVGDVLPVWNYVQTLNTSMSMADILAHPRVAQYLTTSSINERWENKRTYAAIKEELLEDGGFEGAFAFAPNASTIREYLETVEPKDAGLAARMKAEFQMFGLKNPAELNAILAEVVKER